MLSGGELQSPAPPEPRVSGFPLLAQTQLRILLSSSGRDQSMEMSSKTGHIVGMCLEMQFKETKGILEPQASSLQRKHRHGVKQLFSFYFGPPRAEQRQKVRRHCQVGTAPRWHHHHGLSLQVSSPASSAEHAEGVFLIKKILRKLLQKGII